MDDNLYPFDSDFQRMETERVFLVPAGYRLPSSEEINVQLARPDGIIRLIPIGRKRSWWERLFGVSHEMQKADD